jgi:spore maturation protein CgeB
MRVLSVLGKNYAGWPGAIEPMYLEFTVPLMDLGHTVEHFDHTEARKQFGLDGCGDRFVKQVRNGRYDLVLYATAGQDWMPPEAIHEARRYALIVAWNSDDDWQWNSYTMKLAPYFSFMVTTYSHIYEANRGQYSNLRLSQWGCYDRLADFSRNKDMDFTFVGRVYGYRNQDCRYLRSSAGLRVFGEGSRLVRLGLPIFRGCTRIPGLMGEPIADYTKVNTIWNRSRISYTPLGSSADPHKLQIKGRVFQMGLSGTLMLCDNHPDLARYYEPGKEFVVFDDLTDCVEKAKYYLAHENERAHIAQAYHDRTRAEHLWQHRFVRLFKDIGLIHV